ncbi:putative ABC transporter permease [Candidatus Saccharibacteria bacterium]|nr:putative ABC transporter permease [Candidatus Saccharibacteria bacterium]MBR2658339.1 putative ABC transporter permease [Candidatus Saccharibacteria bacterium]
MTEKKFAEGVCFKKLFFIFIIGCLFGCIYETLLTFFTNLLRDGSIVWVSRSGLLYGQFSPIYGVGAVLMVYFLTRRDFKWWQIFLLGSLIGGIFEYLAGAAQEIFTGTSSWNYSDQWLNIGGKTSVFIMAVWGLTCLFLMKIIYPIASDLIEKIPPKIGDIIFWTLLVFIAIDCLLSLSAVIRMNLRRHHVPTFTPYGQFLDTVYTDERIHRSYTNMENID